MLVIFQFCNLLPNCYRIPPLIYHRNIEQMDLIRNKFDFPALITFSFFLLFSNVLWSSNIKLFNTKDYKIEESKVITIHNLIGVNDAEDNENSDNNSSWFECTNLINQSIKNKLIYTGGLQPDIPGPLPLNRLYILYRYLRL